MVCLPACLGDVTKVFYFSFSFSVFCFYEERVSPHAGGLWTVDCAFLVRVAKFHFIFHLILLLISCFFYMDQD